jgi:hypothetical protein
LNEANITVEVLIDLLSSKAKASSCELTGASPAELLVPFVARFSTKAVELIVIMAPPTILFASVLFPIHSKAAT